MFDFFRSKLNSQELHWLDRRTRDEYGMGIPDAVREKIIKLGYGVPQGLYSFALTPKGIDYLKQHGLARGVGENYH